MRKVDELKKYVTEQGIKYQVNEKTGVQKNYMMSPRFAECGFSGMTGICF